MQFHATGLKKDIRLRDFQMPRIWKDAEKSENYDAKNLQITESPIHTYCKIQSRFVR